MDRRRKNESGLSLVELLVVLGIIAVITSVSIPMFVRSGNSTSNKTALAARELFTVLRAAKIYATTHNVETAVVYGGLLVQDSFSGVTVPVVDSMTIVRRLKRKEMAELLLAGALTDFSVNYPLYVQVREGNSNFKRMPDGTCILPDVFEVGLGANYSRTGLTGVIVYDPLDRQFLSPRTGAYPGNTTAVLAYALSSDPDGFPAAFPAHRFSPEGALLPDQSLPQQRVRFRVGLLPSADPSDRFFVDLGDDRQMDIENIDLVDIRFSDLPDEPSSIEILHDPNRFNFNLLDTPIDIDVDIFIYVPTGRVKVGS